jgi:hypothetical protein
MNLKSVKIKSKKSIGVQPVYDLCVPGEHHYILQSGVVSHNSGFIYASSIVVAMKKLKLKEDEDGNKTSEVHGIRAACKVMKTRYAKPFEGVQIKIPYSTGMNPYSGLVELFEAKGVIEKSGNRLQYVTSDGEQILEYRKNWTGALLDTVMEDYKLKEAMIAKTIVTEDTVELGETDDE